MSAWQPIETAPQDCTVILTQHVEDPYPVSAFSTGDNIWRREMEGPEDMIPPQPGRWFALLRTPTHWQPLPEPPAPEATRG